MGKPSRSKGKRGELEVAKLLERLFPDARRGAAQSRRGDDCADVEGTPYWIECKRVKRNEQPRGAMEQAQAATDGRPPVVFTRRDNSEWLVTMTAELALEMMMAQQMVPRASETRDRWASRMQDWILFAVDPAMEAGTAALVSGESAVLVTGIGCRGADDALHSENEPEEVHSE